MSQHPNEAILNKIAELTQVLAISAGITGDHQSQFLAKMFLTSMVAARNIEHMDLMAKKIVEFIDELEVKGGNITIGENAERRGSICAN